MSIKEIKISIINLRDEVMEITYRGNENIIFYSEAKRLVVNRNVMESFIKMIENM
jgi:hypothetical protein